jgi:hypothetical protein
VSRTVYVIGQGTSQQGGRSETKRSHRNLPENGARSVDGESGVLLEFASAQSNGVCFDPNEDPSPNLGAHPECKFSIVNSF